MHLTAVTLQMCERKDLQRLATTCITLGLDVGQQMWSADTYAASDVAQHSLHGSHLYI